METENYRRGEIPRWCRLVLHEKPMIQAARLYLERTLPPGAYKYSYAGDNYCIDMCLYQDEISIFTAYLRSFGVTDEIIQVEYWKDL